MSSNPVRMRRALVTGALVAGASLGAAGMASAATGSTVSGSGSASATGPSAAARASPPAGQAGDPTTMTHGPNETLLTGSQLEKVTAAADGAVPGATVIRAETNSSDASPYEVHMKKSDGAVMTVELDSNFGVITTVSGFGAGPVGSQIPGGAPPTSSVSSY